MSTIQVICEKADKTDIPTIDKKKYLVPSVSHAEIPSSRDASLLREMLRSDTIHTGSDCGPIRLRNPEAHQART